VITPNTPPITLDSATNSVSTALLLDPAGAFCTASARVMIRVMSLCRTRNICRRLNSDGSLSQSAAACATSGGITISPTTTKTPTMTM
jgi:hypothetical protein